MTRPGPFVGIDFGTSTSVVAWYDPETGRADVIANSVGETKTPSVVLFADDSALIGHEAETELRDAAVEPDAEVRADTVGRVVQGIKRRLVAPPVFAVPGHGIVRPGEVVALVLAQLKREAEETHFYREVPRVVLTCPAVFTHRERQVLHRAAEAAGFHEVELLEEPTAAALAFHRQGQQRGDVVLVYDLGAGTFDLSVVVRDEDGGYYTPLKPEGDANCGGDDFDRALYEHCEKLAVRDLERPISPTGDVDLAFLAQCRDRKHNLSARRQTRFSSLLASDGAPVVFKHEIARAEFEDLIRADVEETVRRTAAMLERCRRRGYEVDSIVLIGGSTQVPLVERLLVERLGITPHKYANRDHAVALGAAYHAFAVWGGGAAAPPTAVDPRTERYRQALVGCWADGRLTHSEVAWLRELANYELGLQQDRRQSVEQAVLGDTLDAVVDRQRAAVQGHYDVALRLLVDGNAVASLRRIPRARWDTLLSSSELFRSLALADCPVTPADRVALLGSAPWPAFVTAARLVRDLDLDDPSAPQHVRAVADELGLSPDDAVVAERVVLGRPVDDHLRDLVQAAAAARVAAREADKAERRAAARAETDERRAAEERVAAREQAKEEARRRDREAARAVAAPEVHPDRLDELWAAAKRTGWVDRPLKMDVRKVADRIPAEERIVACMQLALAWKWSAVVVMTDRFLHLLSTYPDNAHWRQFWEAVPADFRESRAHVALPVDDVDDLRFDAQDKELRFSVRGHPPFTATVSSPEKVVELILANTGARRTSD